MAESELFHKYIEIEGESSSTSRSQPNTKKEQFNKIAAFHEEYKEQLNDKDLFDQLWEKLTVELNTIGPPVYASSGWRKKWAERKYNKKRKRSVNPETPSKESQDQPSHARSIQSSIPISENLEFGQKIVEVSTKQDLIIEELRKSNRILEEIPRHQNVIICELKKSNLILEEIAKRK